MQTPGKLLFCELYRERCDDFLIRNTQYTGIRECVNTNYKKCVSWQCNVEGNDIAVGFE